jgi:predicted nucleic acid-binding protein
LATTPVYLLDANVLLRLAQSAHPQHGTTRSALQTLRAGGARLVTAPQSLYEFWAVATRPAVNRGGLGMPTAGATAYLNLYELHFPMLGEVPVYAEWKRLVTSYGVAGLNTHDARLAAFMLVQGVTHLLTFNTKDFNRYGPEGLAIVDPATVTANT